MRNVLVLGFSLLTACSIGNDDAPPKKELTKSSAVPLEQLNGSYGAFDDGTHIELFVAFVKDGFVLVRDGDNVTLDVNGTAVPLTERIEGDKVHYVGDFASPPAEPVVTVTFTRGSEKVVGKVRIAPAFEMKSPPTTAKVGDVLSLDIDPRPDLTQWQGPLGQIIGNAVEIHGDCIDKGEERFPLGSTYPVTWDTAGVRLVPGSTGCEVDVQMRLETNAEKFEGKFGGGFEGLQHRRFKLTLTN